MNSEKNPLDKDKTPVVRYVDCNDASEFLEAISPTGSYFINSNLGETWIFRGIKDSAHLLIPAALRPENTNQLYSLAGIGLPENEVRETNIMQGVAELSVLANFYRIADSHGLMISEDTRKIRSYLQHPTHNALASVLNATTSWEGWRGWILDELLALAGLAQHYGLPTRLIDWTRDSMVAAYFAAIGAVKEIRMRKEKVRSTSQDLNSDSSKRLAVWALSVDLISFNSSHLPFVFVTAPAATNPNLNAQKGVFTLWREQLAPKNSKLAINRESLDALVSNTLRNHQSVTGTLLYRFTLPVLDSIDLLYLVFKHGYTSAMLFPGFGGVASHMRDLQLVSDEEALTFE